ncbi:MAG: fatty acid desaturase [Methylococcales bacterium]|nr:fatty acid desaturase [Methylococcales bacterium]
MKKYEVGPATRPMVEHDYTEYREFVALVRKDFKEVKATPLWFIKSIVSALAFIYTFYWQAYIHNEESLLIQCICGFFLLSLGFSMIHDASHYAVSTNPRVNIIICKIWMCCSYWQHFIWGRHHVYGHHSFTGDEKRDPDQRNSRPFFKKFKKDTRIFNYCKDKQHIIAPITMLLIPGQYIGMLISYAQAIFKGHLWGMSINNKEILNNMGWFEWVLYAFNTYTWTLFSWRFMLIFVVAGNIFYHIAIVPDHDTFENAVEFKYYGNNYLRRQIENSGNFMNNNYFYSQMFGGINF